MTQPRWDGLDPAQAGGLACVICTRELRGHSTPRVPVGHSVTGSPVMACTGSCAQQATLPAWRLGIPGEAWTAAGIAFLTALDDTTSKDVRDAYPDDLITPTVRAAAGLIVAAELRRLATQYQPGTDPRLSYAQRRHREGIAAVCAALTERADELDPAGGAR